MTLRTRVVNVMHRHRGWRLWLVATLVCVVAVIGIVALADLGIKGQIFLLDMLVGGVVTAAIAPVFMVVLNDLLSEARLRDQAALAARADVAQSRLAAALEATRLICWEANLTTGTLEYVGAQLKVLGLDAESGPRTIDAWLQRVHPEDRDELRRQIDDIVTRRDTILDAEYRFDAGDGTLRWLNSRSQSTAWGAEGRATHAVGTTMDITERKQAETALEASRALLHATLQSTDEGILVIGADGKVLTYNQSFLTLWRIPPDLAALGEDRPLLDHVLDQLVDPAAFIARVQSLYGSDAESRDTLAFKDGRTFTRYSQSLRVDHAGARIWCFKDVTEQRRSENALRESERKLLTILDGVDAFIYLKDLQGRYLFANRRVRELWNTPLEAVVGQGDERFFDATTAAMIRANDAKVLVDGRTLRTEETNTLATGGPAATYLSTKLPLRDPDGRIYALCGISIDITARKAAEAELERHREHLAQLVEERTAELLATEQRALQILQSSADGLLGLDLTGTITLVNRAACALLGWPAEAMVGARAHPLFHHSREDGTPYPEDECPMLHAMRRGVEARVDDEVFFDANGVAIPVMYAVHPTFKADELTGAVVSFVDMRAQRASAVARERALLAAEELARVRREFLANMSHEIRTPLNGVLGFAQIGQRNAGDPQKSRNAFDKILIAGKTLLGVVDEILDFSRIEAGKMSMRKEPVDLRQLVADAVDMVRERAAAKQLSLNLRLDPSLPATCLGDDQRIEQVLLNLLSNAVKFTESGQVSISAARDDGHLTFVVEDTGIGIGEEALAQLFNPFHQADASTTRRFGGTGLGLAISKRIAELMNGDIRVSSTPGSGSRFEFLVPYVAVAPTAAGAQAGDVPKGTPLAGYRILVAEDDDLNSNLIEAYLVELGAQVVMVDNGQAVLDRVAQEAEAAFDVVLMDVQMPEMDGYEATRRLRERAPTLPIIGQTAHAFVEERERCFAAGMVDHIAKPISPADLVDKIRRHARPQANDRLRA